jgi:hypothetical protein
MRAGFVYTSWQRGEHRQRNDGSLDHGGRTTAGRCTAYTSPRRYMTSLRRTYFTPCSTAQPS